MVTLPAICKWQYSNSLKLFGCFFEASSIMERFSILYCYYFNSDSFEVPGLNPVLMQNISICHCITNVPKIIILYDQAESDKRGLTKDAWQQEAKSQSEDVAVMC